MSEHKAETFLAGFLLGGIIGAGVALLFAPASGVETREQIQKQVNRVLEEGKEGSEYVKKLVQDEIENIKGKTGAVKDAVEKGVAEFKKNKA
ncbi:MAG TPA: YtxH domain-containing protein [candidate division Zixibacteria bacterium]|nr:YtxH domain-containing protein [candidate division Zixibacteria bacterium]